ncbi:hypothetical protein [Streptomyces griseosporeus]|uniref:hypothetical protein n=1 Tax=Streptomyces griseosporeus TaxID=1910 RepID=UPI0036F7287D
MNLWDVEVGRFADGLQGCSSGSLRRLGLRVIEETVTVYGRPVDELFDEATVSLYRRAVDEFRSFDGVGSAGSADTVREEWDRLFADAWDWQDGRSPFTAASLCQALAQYADFLLAEGAAEGLLEVLSSCYESVLSFASLGRVVTVDMEREDPRCRRAIDLQSALIEEICGIS